MNVELEKRYLACKECDSFGDIVIIPGYPIMECKKCHTQYDWREIELNTFNYWVRDHKQEVETEDGGTMLGPITLYFIKKHFII